MNTNKKTMISKQKKERRYNFTVNLNTFDKLCNDHVFVIGIPSKKLSEKAEQKMGPGKLANMDNDMQVS